MSDRLLKESDVLRIAFQLPLVVNSAFADAVKALPSADRPQGEWIDKGWKGDWQFETDGRGNCWYEYECSECGFRNKGSKSNYCPKCGADMRERESKCVDCRWWDGKRCHGIGRQCDYQPKTEPLTTCSVNGKPYSECSSCEHFRCTADDPQADLIKRSDAVEAIENVDWYHQNIRKDMVSGANSDEHQAWYKADDIYEALETVPSINRKE